MNASNKENGLLIDYLRLVTALWKKKILIAVVSVLCAIVTVLGAVLLIKPEYQADILVYVNNHTISLGSTALTFSSGELTAARALLDTYIVALKSRTTLDGIIEQADLPYTRGQLSKMISAGSVNKTEWFTVTVTADDPEEARIIANTAARVLPEVLSSTIEGSSVKVLDYAIRPQGKVDPGYKKYAVLGFAAGFALTVLCVIIKEILNDKIHNEDTLAEMSDTIPVLATIPHNGMKGSYSKYEYGDDNKKNGSGSSHKNKSFDDAMAVCGDLDFSQTEAYNLLQTSVQYSFENDGCKVVGITSSERNEGKSTLAVNLAYSLSADKKKVLLLDGDMRLPSIAKKLGLESTPGLSDYLTGKAQNNDGIQRSKKAPLMSVICAGVVPPNPFRLIGSASMERLINALKEVYDYIIVDLPPVNIVSDPLSVAKYLDGFIIVARSEYSTRQGIMDVVKKLEVVKANILGFVVNSNSSSSDSKYGKYNKYGKYGKYGKYAASVEEYENSYERAAKEITIRTVQPDSINSDTSKALKSSRKV